MIIYGDRESGNCYKVSLLCSLLNIEHVWVDIDILAGETNTAAFLKKNPNGKIPLLEITDGQFLAESNAILCYLAENSHLVPTNSYERAKMLQWLFFEQYSHEPFIAVARFINKYLGLPEERCEEYRSKQKGGHKALKVMNEQLECTPFLVGDRPSLADLSLYAYTHVAGEGGFDITSYEHICSWLKRIESMPGYSAMAG